jgi:hypothetical protein
MECREPGTIRDEELLAYLAGEQVRPEIEEHLHQCQVCSERVATYQRIENRLVHTLYRWDCPSSQVLGEFQLGLLDAELAAVVSGHLQGCVLCNAEFVLLTEFLADDPMLAERVAPAAQQDIYQPVREVQHVMEQAQDFITAGLRQIVAVLLPVQAGFAYQRTAEQHLQWPRNYTAEDLTVSLQIEKDPHDQSSVQLIGLVTSAARTFEELQGIAVQLTTATGFVDTQHIDELGNFIFSSLAPATYALTLRFPDKVIVIEQLPVALQE